jgi:hypothetical protein
MAHDANFDVSDRDTVLGTMFAQRPTGMIMAISDNGLFTAMPTTVPVTSQVVIKGAPSAVELVVPQDRVAVIEAWERVLAEGMANALVHPMAAPGETVRTHFVDVRYRYGVVLGFVTDFTGPLTSAAGLGGVEVVPRVGVLRKDAVAVITVPRPQRVQGDQRRAGARGRRRASAVRGAASCVERSATPISSAGSAATSSWSWPATWPVRRRPDRSASTSPSTWPAAGSTSAAGVCRCGRASASPGGVREREPATRSSPAPTRPCTRPNGNGRDGWDWW